jgi:hypothetical protein
MCLYGRTRCRFFGIRFPRVKRITRRCTIASCDHRGNSRNLSWHSNTGRAQLRIEPKAVLDWIPRILGQGADGFFKFAIRKNPSAVCWSWALEWNHKHRIIGFLGDQDSAEAIFSTFPQPEMHWLPGSPNERWRFREEVPLSEETDKLFSLGDS